MNSVADAFGRTLSSLRLSVTDRCNLRCQYCMPEADYRWLPTAQILTFEEMTRLASVFVALGARRLRVTGGEPLLRRDLPTLIKGLASLSGLEDLALTTNGVLLEDQAQALRDAGLHRLTVSLDTLHAERFTKLTRQTAHDKVLKGLSRAAAVGFPGGLKLDAVVIRGVNDDELIALLDHAATVNAELRFIEYMDVGGATQWSSDQVVSRQQMLTLIGKALGTPVPIAEASNAPAERFLLRDGRTFGIIASTTTPFCGRCDRSRVTADGHWFRCLYAREGLDLKALLRQGATDAELSEAIVNTWSQRRDRGAEERLALDGTRTTWRTRADLQGDPLLEMHTRGG